MKAVSLMVLEKMHKVLDDPKMHRLTPRSPSSKVDFLRKTHTNYGSSITYSSWVMRNWMVIINKVFSIKYLMTPRSTILSCIKINRKTSGGIMTLNIYGKFDLKPISNEDLNGQNWKMNLMTLRAAILSRIKKIRKTSGGIMPLNVYSKFDQKPSYRLGDRARTDGRTDGQVFPV